MLQDHLPRHTDPVAALNGKKSLAQLLLISIEGMTAESFYRFSQKTLRYLPGLALIHGQLSLVRHKVILSIPYHHQRLICPQAYLL